MNISRDSTNNQILLTYVSNSKYIQFGQIFRK